eukprot:73067-Alexandrium_andersonii.AAC.1
MPRSSPATVFRNLLRCPSPLKICLSVWRAFDPTNVRLPCSFQSLHLRARAAREVGPATFQV